MILAWPRDQGLGCGATASSSDISEATGTPALPVTLVGAGEPVHCNLTRAATSAILHCRATECRRAFGWARVGDQSTTAELPRADVLSGGLGWFGFRGQNLADLGLPRGHLRDTQVAAEGLREERIARLLPKNSSQVCGRVV